MCNESTVSVIDCPVKRLKVFHENIARLWKHVCVGKFWQNSVFQFVCFEENSNLSLTIMLGMVI